MELVPLTCCREQSQGLVAGTTPLVCADLEHKVELSE